MSAQNQPEMAAMSFQEPARLTPLGSEWARREHFAHFRTVAPCLIAMTAEVDVTALVHAVKAAGRRAYVAQIWAVATVINRQPETRMALLPDGSPGVWDVVHPAFTILHPERETFSALWTPYVEDFGAFHAAAVELMVDHRDAAWLHPQPDRPANLFDVPSIPWTSFTGFALGMTPGDHLLPIVTVGRYREVEGRVLLPVAVQIHHAAADGLHVSRVYDGLRELAADPGWVG